MDVGVVDVLSRKEKMLQEHTKLLAEARKSHVDRETGRVRCLSCGNVFRALSALADHLRKHGGVNSMSYTPSRVVGTSYEIFRGQPVERPSDIQLRDLMNPATKPYARKQRKTKEAKTKSPVADTSQRSNVKKENREPKPRKKNKMTPLKRTILIHQVLTLTETLHSLHQELDFISVDHGKTNATLSPETKKQMKKAQGCINATRTELQTALTTVNRKFTFRQLVMMEYLTNHMELLDAMAGVNSEDAVPINDPLQMDIDDDSSTMETESADYALLELYAEVDLLAQEMEESQEAHRGRKENVASMGLVETRRDSESGLIFIKKPEFVESASAPLPSVSSAPIEPETCIKEEEMKQKASPHETVDEDSKDMSEDDTDDLFLSSLETSSDDNDEMWGFSDVLAEWAKQTKHTAKKARPSVYQYFQEDTTSSHPHPIPGGEQETTRSETNDTHSDQRIGIHVLHAGKTVQKSHEQNRRGIGEWENEEETGEIGQPRSVFIRPHLAFSEDSENDPSVQATPGKEKHGRKKSKQFSPPVISSAEKTPRVDTPASSKSASEPPESLDESVHLLLSRLNSRQHGHMRANNGQSCCKWIVSGFAEVSRHLKRPGAVKLIVIANNLDASIQPKVHLMQVEAEKHQVPLVFALTRKKIGQIYHYRKRMSVVAVLNCQDLQEAFETVIRLSQEGGSLNS